MAFATIEPDVSESQLSLALLLYDAFTGARELIGDISVSLSYGTLTSPLTSPPLLFQQTLKKPYPKAPKATFLFFGLLTGEYIAHIRSNVDLPDQTPPYYLPADIIISVTDIRSDVFARWRYVSSPPVQEPV